VPVARRVLPRGIFDRFALTFSELLSVRFFAVEWNAWATLYGQSLGSVIVIAEKPGQRFPSAPDIQ
jgi:hypothetical protein